MYLIRITGTCLVNVKKVAFPKENKVPIQMFVSKFSEIYTSLSTTIPTFAEYQNTQLLELCYHHAFHENFL